MCECAVVVFSCVLFLRNGSAAQRLRRLALRIFHLRLRRRQRLLVHALQRGRLRLCLLGLQLSALERGAEL